MVIRLELKKVKRSKIGNYTQGKESGERTKKESLKRGKLLQAYA